jgi:hypothetical protein
MGLIDHPEIDGETVKDFLTPFGVDNIDITRLEGEEGKTDVVKVHNFDNLFHT